MTDTATQSDYMATVKRFERLQVFTPLEVFKTSLFNHLSTPPNLRQSCQLSHGLLNKFIVHNFALRLKLCNAVLIMLHCSEIHNVYLLKNFMARDSGLEPLIRESGQGYWT